MRSYSTTVSNECFRSRHIAAVLLLTCVLFFTDCGAYGQSYDGHWDSRNQLGSLHEPSNITTSNGPHSERLRFGLSNTTSGPLQSSVIFSDPPANGYPIAVSSTVPPLAISQLLAPKRSLSAPTTVNNLKIYMISGRAESPDYSSTPLNVGIKNGTVRVLETSNVNSVTIENNGLKPVFAHSGDIVKGGRQDRLLRYDSVTSPHQSSSVAAFCIEHGRWSKRGYESHEQFSAPANENYAGSGANQGSYGGNGFIGSIAMAARLNGVQTQVWQSAEDIQNMLSRSLGARIENPLSSTSLELTLEHPAVQNELRRYLPRLSALPANSANSIGYLAFVNNEFIAGDVYPNHDMFVSYWPRLLGARIVDAMIAGQQRFSRLDNIDIDRLQNQAGSISPVNTRTLQVSKSSTALALFHTIDRAAKNAVVHVSLVRH